MLGISYKERGMAFNPVLVGKAMLGIQPWALQAVRHLSLYYFIYLFCLFILFKDALILCDLGWLETHGNAPKGHREGWFLST